MALWVLTEVLGSASSSSERTWLFSRKGRSRAGTDELLSFPHPMEGCIHSNRVMCVNSAWEGLEPSMDSC